VWGGGGVARREVILGKDGGREVVTDNASPPDPDP
jgi:hypothetical protein